MLHNKRMWWGLVGIFVLAIIVGTAVFWIKKNSNTNVYSVVYLKTGEVYIGHLTTFPDLELKDGYILQIVKDTKDVTKNNFQINPLNEAVWAPKVLHLVRDNIVFYGPLSETSPIAKKLAQEGK